MIEQRHFLLLATLAALAAGPASGQEAARPVTPAGSDAQGVASIPDFSGIWSHPSFPGFEPPASEPGPVRNKGDMELSGMVGPTPTIQCWPEPVPYIFNGVAMQMLQGPDKIVFLYPNDHQVRYVRMNATHAAQVTPSWYGDSVGHYEGDTLVVDTVGVKIGPFAMVDFYGTPYTQALHVVERYRLLDYEVAREGLERDVRENRRPGQGADAGSAPDYSYRGKHLQLEFTVEDEGVFTMPWSATVTYRRGAEPWREVVCAENTRELALAGRSAAVPHADKPDF